MATSEVAAEDFFSSTPAPLDLKLVKEKVESFVTNHSSNCRKIVLITVSYSIIKPNTVLYMYNDVMHNYI